MNWLEISVETEAAAIETVSAIFHEHGEGGVAVHQNVIPDDEDGAYHYDTSKPTIVVTYLPATVDGERRRELIKTALGHLTVFDLATISEVRSREVSEDEWANSWKEFYYPMRFGPRLVVKPSWREFTPRASDLVMHLDPGMAFGTGLHQTTAMCLELLDSVVQPGDLVLDQGTGSGILAIGAALLGAAQVAAIDLSEVAVQSSQENVERNGLSEHIVVRQGTTVPSATAILARQAGERYDLVIANIIASVIAAMAEDFVAVLKANGYLLASGIIRDKEAEVVAALTRVGFQIERREQRDEWIALVARLNDTAASPVP